MELDIKIILSRIISIQKNESNDKYSLVKKYYNKIPIVIP